MSLAGWRDRRHRNPLRPAQILARLLATLFVTASVVQCESTASAASYSDAVEFFRTGKYEDCARLAEQELLRTAWNEDWRVLKIRSEMTLGRYQAALETLEAGLQRSTPGLELRLLAPDVYRFNGREADADAVPASIERMVLASPRRFSSATNRVALGRYFLMRGADARKVLDQFYDTATKLEPDLIDVYFATAELALAKQDDALAADTLKGAPKEAAQHPQFHYLTACAFLESDRAKSAESLEAALAVNPRHVDSLLLKADQLIDAEQYDDAAGVLGAVQKVNPREPRAWAYRAVLAHLKSDAKAEQSARDSALAFWPTNPEVDHLMGRKLSQKYRFAEGVEAQRKSLTLDSGYRQAKLQLCQDLLRLGEEEEGWRLADEIVAEDGYNVVGYNLVTLRDELEGFRTLRDGAFVVRMTPREADLYGDRVLDLLREAKNTLCEKYEVPIEDPIVVEIFPQKKDFAVRTFGLPGADGFLGVCFGRVITVNSPASRGDSPSNWESVLWHEFCHTVTLTKTRNKMPRWLSEGISVYEEGQRNPAWATVLNPRFREMLLGDELTPLSELSSAFLRPKSGMHLQFAYYESSLAVEFLVDRFGLETLKTLLDDLAEGIPLNDSLAVRTASSIENLDDAFANFARERAAGVAPDATWEQPDLPARADARTVAAWLDEHPDNFWATQRLAAAYVAGQQWEDAMLAAKRLKELYPEYVGPQNAYEILATAYQKQGDTSAARSELENLASRDASATAAFTQLMQLAEAENDWEAVGRNADRHLAVNPLVVAPHRAAARAAEEMGDISTAVAAYRAWSRLDDTDPAGLHYRLANLLRQDRKPDDSLREVLMALEEAPRYLEAQRLLLELIDRRADSDAAHRTAPVEATKP
ncbi:MAG: peptidase MA family metallohydrolase [Planctomycetota bacterium]|nr:hypothetical protein [Planctomycetaceae bacterium]MDQ3332646.1 peptidase MA family metallohydrolase [Planctomycetota bacterium]